MPDYDLCCLFCLCSVVYTPIPLRSYPQPMTHIHHPRPSLHLPPLHRHYRFRILSKCLNTVTFASRNRSTQFRIHGSSYLSSAPCDTFVMHLRKHTSVRLCIELCSRAFWLSATANCCRSWRSAGESLDGSMSVADELEKSMVADFLCVVDVKCIV